LQVLFGADGGRLVVKPHKAPRYTMEELLAQCKPNAKRSRQDREWLRGRPAGGELI
jgi:antitoxin ChpS